MQYRKGGGTFSDDNCRRTGVGNCTGLDDNCDGITNTNTTIIDRVWMRTLPTRCRCRAKNAEGTSAWSRASHLKTNKGTNQPPAFIDSNTQQDA